MSLYGLWCVYMVRCVDGSLYTGLTNNLAQRIQVHNQGRAAKYTRSRLPVVLVYSILCQNRAVAARVEARIKKLSKQKKEFLISKTNAERQEYQEYLRAADLEGSG